VVDETEVELRLYREKIVAELERRVLVLQDIERRLASAQFVFEKAQQMSRTFSGNTARKQVQNAHRVKLRGALKDLERERIEAKADVERAEIRLQDVDLRLDELVREQEEV
jgi:hypothetical protein